MKNFFKILGLIALVAVIGFSMAACGGDDDGGGGGGSGGGSSSYGTLTVTGIPLEYNGKYAGMAAVLYTDHYYWFYERINPEPIISNRSVTMSFSAGTKGYSGNDTFSVSVYINEDLYGDNTIAWRIFDSVTFSNGSATVAWSGGRVGPLP